MDNRYAKHVNEMEARILRGPGAVDPATRRAAAEGTPLGDPMVDAYLETVRRHAYRVTDGDIEDLKQAGWTEEQVFELTVAAAFGAGKRRLDAGLRALEAALAARAPAEVSEGGER